MTELACVHSLHGMDIDHPKDLDREERALAGSVPVWYIGGYWTLPLGWLTNSILINEFSAPRWQIPYIYDPSVGHTPLNMCVSECG